MCFCYLPLFFFLPLTLTLLPVASSNTLVIRDFIAMPLLAGWHGKLSKKDIYTGELCKWEGKIDFSSMLQCDPQLLLQFDFSTFDLGPLHLWLNLRTLMKVTVVKSTRNCNQKRILQDDCNHVGVKVKQN